MKRTNIFFYSDPHFGHKAVIGYSNRPFKSLEEMHEKLISKWNNIVKADDLVYVLGDWSMYMSKGDLKVLNARLNGTKVLIRGNHDMSPIEMINIGFAACVENAEIVIAGERVIMSHYPYKRPWYYDLYYRTLNKLFPKKYWKPKYFVKQLKDDGLWLLHGHVHSKRRLFVPGKKMIHVGVDAWGYAPVPLHKVSEIIVATREGRYKEDE